MQFTHICKCCKKRREKQNPGIIHRKRNANSRGHFCIMEFAVEGMKPLGDFGQL